MITSNTNSKNSFDEAFKAMLNDRKYCNDYMFYAHMISNCKVILDKDLPAAAGVNFTHTTYNLYINPEMFNEEPMTSRLGILKHEMLHILYNHMSRKADRNHEGFNISSDCAINQHITRTHLPDYAIYPDNIGEQLKIKVPENETAEFYYDLFKQELEKQKQDQQDCDNDGEGEGKPGNGNPFQDKNSPKSPRPIDDHGKWKETEGDEALRKSITKKMIEKSIENTSKVKGNVPSAISHFLELFTDAPKVSWKREIRKIQGNRKSNVRSTIMKKSRRFGNRDDLRGKTSSTTFDTCVVVDVSGSMDDKEILFGLNEIHALCKLTNSTMRMIQIDTEIHAVEIFSKSTKLFNRSGNGGTRMEPAMDYIKYNNIPADLVVLITDGEIEDISRWKNPPRKLIALVTTKGHNIPGLESHKSYKQFNITDV